MLAEALWRLVLTWVSTLVIVRVLVNAKGRGGWHDVSLPARSASPVPVHFFPFPWNGVLVLQSTVSSCSCLSIVSSTSSNVGPVKKALKFCSRSVKQAFSKVPSQNSNKVPVCLGVPSENVGQPKNSDNAGRLDANAASCQVGELPDSPFADCLFLMNCDNDTPPLG